MNTLSPELESVLAVLLVMADAQKTPVFQKAVEEIRDLAMAIRMADEIALAAPYRDSCRLSEAVRHYHNMRDSMRAKRGTE